MMLSVCRIQKYKKIIYIINIKGPTRILTNIQTPSITQANPQARGLSPTLSEPKIREISPGMETINPDNTTTIPAINE